MTRKSATGILGALLDQGKSMNSGPLLVLCTCPDKGVATAIATALLDQRLAACVNLVEGIESLYRWDGKLRRDQEVLLMIKTVTESFEPLEQLITELHPYELPEIIGVPLSHGSASYLDWLTESTRR